MEHSQDSINRNQKSKIKERIFLEWSNINYSVTLKVDKKKNKTEEVPSNQEKFLGDRISSEADQLQPKVNQDNKRIILNNISGFAKPNELSVIMGPSGCGKTSLLNIIACRQLPQGKNLSITREVKANNIPMDETNFGIICAYIMQDDILLDCLTVRESLTFGAKLKLRESNEYINKRVNKLLRQFGLEKCADSIIGSETRKGISGGERKRTSIAYEIISNPPVIIIDEPTTGMDSFTSLVIIKYLKFLAQTGKTIICTIHQPSSEIFTYIDRVILLRDGHLVYQGRAEHSVRYFDEIGYKMPAYMNPFDFFLGVLTDQKTDAKELNSKYLSLCEAEVRDETVRLHEEFREKEIPSLTKNLRQISFCKEYQIVLKRTITNYIRNKSLFWTRVLNCLFNSLIIVGFYWGIGAESKQNNLFANYLGFFFNTTNQFFINGIFTPLFMIPVLKLVLKREYAAKLYRFYSFYWSVLIILLINSLIYSLIFSPMTWFSIQLLTDFTHFFYYFLTNFFIYTLGQLIGLALGGTFPEEIANSIAPPIFILCFIGSGFYRGNSSMPDFISWLFYITPYRYMLEIYLKIEASFKPGITDLIPIAMDYDKGLEVCLPVLLGTMVIVVVLGFFGLRAFTRKF